MENSKSIISPVDDPELMCKLKAFWFSRWIGMNYGGFLNKEKGNWYAKQLKHFEDKVFPQWIVEATKNGDLTNTLAIISSGGEEIEFESIKTENGNN